MAITLRQLRYLQALAETLHFGKAARACAVSQPALSMQIKELEDTLGVTLVERRRASVQLTDEGREVVRCAARVLLDVQDIEAVGAKGQGPLGRRLTLGVIPTVAPYFLPRVLSELQRRYPSLEVHLQEARTERLLEEVGRGVLDAAVLALPVADERFRSAPILNDRFLLAVPSNREIPDPARLVDLQPGSLILLEEGHCLRDQALDVCGPDASGLMNRFGATSLATIMQMVAGGYGSTLVPEMAVPVEFHEGMNVRLTHFAGKEPARTIGLIWRKSVPRPGRFETLASALSEIWSAARPQMAEPA